MMNPAERTEVATSISNTYRMYGQSPDRDLVRMLVDDLCDLSAVAVLNALIDYRRNPKNKFAPRTADIRSAITGPPVDDEAEAQVAVGLIFEAIRIHGWNQGSRAREYMGELAWAAVEAFGGWFHLCADNLGSESTVRAQLRDYLEAAQLRARQGRTGVAPAAELLRGVPMGQLPASDGPDAFDSVRYLASKTVKGIE